MKTNWTLALVLIPSLWLTTACKTAKSHHHERRRHRRNRRRHRLRIDGGSATDISSSARTAALLNNSVFCGLTGDTTITATGTQGRHLDRAWTWLVNCMSGTPSSISLDNVARQPSMAPILTSPTPSLRISHRHCQPSQHKL
ncbi:MAG: hypothetical protein IPP17_31255 [Bacteroidetes bacterium]|nr:hypothetical protein [Bacteroidota bacterium]